MKKGYIGKILIGVGVALIAIPLLTAIIYDFSSFIGKGRFAINIVKNLFSTNANPNVIYRWIGSLIYDLRINNIRLFFQRIFLQNILWLLIPNLFIISGFCFLLKQNQDIDFKIDIRNFSNKTVIIGLILHILVLFNFFGLYRILYSRFNISFRSFKWLSFIISSKMFFTSGGRFIYNFSGLIVSLLFRFILVAPTFIIFAGYMQFFKKQEITSSVNASSVNVSSVNEHWSFMSVVAVIGNIIWFIFGGEIIALGWLIIAGLFAITIIGLPIARACLEFAKLTAFPFGKAIIRDTELHNVSVVVRVIHIILNIIWFPFGFILTVVYLVYGIISICTIVGIPAGIVYVRMGRFLLFPIGARVVSKDFVAPPPSTSGSSASSSASSSSAGEAVPAAVPPDGYAPRKRTTALLLLIFLGLFGAHFFYLGNIKYAVCRLLCGVIAVFSAYVSSSDLSNLPSFWFFPFGLFMFIWFIIDLVNICRGKITDKYGRPLVK